ncbi:MAG: tetratricopeptide repeat protein [Bacteroidetes Order II. Incertae sedis bacterium]|nr:tetratricopeptide repeat protein [Bacteroidetes Order II. bacterium]
MKKSIIVLFLNSIFGQIFAQPTNQDYLIQGDMYYNDGNYDMAINSYVVHKLSNSEDKIVNINIGLCYLRKIQKETPLTSIIGIPALTTNAEKAISYFKYYLESQPPISISSDKNVYTTYKLIAETYATMLNWEKTLEYASIMYNINPNYKFTNDYGVKEFYNDANNALANWYCDQAYLYSEKENEIEVKKHYDKALQYFKEPLSEHSLFYRGFANSKLGNSDKAKIDLGNVIKLYPNSSYALLAKQELETININAALQSDPLNNNLLTFERPSYKGEILYYSGEIKNGKANGKGEATTSFNHFYKGDFKDNEYHGKGLHKWTNGDTYEGYWLNGQRTGKGVYKWANNTALIYEGDFVNGQRTGKGKMKWTTGEMYDGEWLNDKQTKGFGVYKYGNDTYTGDLLNNNRHGKGTYKWANGDIYIGDWQNGYRTGYGKYTYMNGKIEEGYFENNILKTVTNTTQNTTSAFSFNEDTEVEKAKLATKEKRYNNAIETYTFLIQKTGQAYLYFERGKIYSTTKEYQKAKNDFHSAINIWSTIQTEKYSWLKEDAQQELRKIENK